MAIKQRALMKLDTTKHHVLRAMGAGRKAALDEVCRDLTEIRDLYREGLPQQDYASYGEIFDGMILAVRNMIKDGDPDVQGDALALCQDLLEHLEKETAKETSFKKEIVFLPYKASMFDSMESVWKVAYEDREHCHAYVIPIPYADRNPDGSVAKWHCESDQFPKYVPTLDWRSVNLKEMHPDVIFIHNQYDASNLVTSVDSSYYSDNLRSLTRLLVLMDYGMPLWMQRDMGKISIPKGANMLPGQWNAHLAVTALREAAELFRISAEKIMSYRQETFDEEDKFIALGSAKFDCIVNARRENYHLPSSWAKKVKDKKVLLYNTSLSELLQQNEQCLEDVRRVLQTAEKNKDVVLWWRPHPLTKATLRSMRPKLESSFHKIVEGFKKRGIGIYDETSDLHRAIVWSDGCLTNESSLAWLYLATGKPFSIFCRGKMLSAPVMDQGKTFHQPLRSRLENMRLDRGANPKPDEWNWCIWWDNFLTEDVLHNVHYANFLERFLHFIVHRDEYPEAEEYRDLQLKMFRSFIVNPDGRAGEKIYRYCLERLSKF